MFKAKSGTVMPLIELLPHSAREHMIMTLGADMSYDQDCLEFVCCPCGCGFPPTSQRCSLISFCKIVSSVWKVDEKVGPLRISVNGRSMAWTCWAEVPVSALSLRQHLWKTSTGDVLVQVPCRRLFMLVGGES